MKLIPRSIYFRNGKAIGTFPNQDYDIVETMWLPTDHYDFIGPISLIGRTKEEIEKDIKNLT